MTARPHLSRKQRFAIMAEHGGVCAECGAVIGCIFEVDHRVAIGLGGRHEPANLAPLHRPCHRLRKTNPDIWAMRKADRIRKRREAPRVPKFKGWRRMDGTIVWAEQR